jgi:hypothetical protein
MKIIAHRGNIEGSSSHENDPGYLITAMLQGFDVETDLWMIKGLLYLGHDKPDYQIKENFIRDYKDRLWVHCKNIINPDSYEFIYREDINYFFHEKDPHVVTSNGYIWTYPGEPNYCNRSIAVLPEMYPDNDIPDYVYGVCTDYAFEWRKKCPV